MVSDCGWAGADQDQSNSTKNALIPAKAGTQETGCYSLSRAKVAAARPSLVTLGPRLRGDERKIGAANLGPASLEILMLSLSKHKRISDPQAEP